MTDKDAGSESTWLGLAKLVAGWDVRQAMMVLGVIAAVVGGYVLVGAINPGALPYTAGLSVNWATYLTAIMFVLLGLALILRSASESYVEKVDKENGMAVVHWTHPQQKFYLRSLRVRGHRSGDVWMDVCCANSHSPQKVAVADDGWLGNIFLDLSETKGMTEVRFYRADGAASDMLDAHVSKTTKNRKFRHMSEHSWPKDGLEELFALQVENA